ncbi:uncharacterized protein LOC118192124 isoform X2 [Stegodyphus dumicola]|uniref:uncharacterized protein LOC118192124 isoform X2 n=1 Tax=Stegodyphus dumicola TaxID=202533 RepID=UPI0015AE696F|nr:uncharacterized protein LOC118192124 isoform X2 [Stegodyphus dumicola]
MNSTPEMNSTPGLDENFQFDTASLWDYSLDPEVPKLFNTVAEDNGCHPLLEIRDSNDEGVEIADVIRCLSSEQLIEIESDTKQKGVDKQVLCKTPCSVWCDCFVKASNSFSTTEKFVDLLSFPTTGFESTTTSESSDKILSMNSPKFPREFPSSRPFFKRSLSVNDTESVYNESSVLEKTRSQDSVSWSTEFSYPYMDSYCSLNMPRYVRSVSWKDSDSGIMSHGSSQEDISFPASEMKDYFRSSKESVISTDDEPMWGPFGGANSLWQHLPDCVPSNDQVNKHGQHKRVRDLKRLKSLN